MGGRHRDPLLVGGVSMDDIGKNIVSWGGNALALIASAVQENEIVQWIMFALGIVGSVLSILVSILRIVSKWKSVSSDGKVTAEEWDELAKTVETEAGNIANAVKKEDNVEKEEKEDAGKDESENR